MSTANDDLAMRLAAARGGSDPDVWALLALYRGYLAQLAIARLAPTLQAKASPSDLVHDTLLEAYRDFTRFRGQTAAEWVGWLRQLLAHNIANFERRYFGTAMRRADREVSLAAIPAAAGIVAGGPSPSSVLIARERQSDVDAGLADLPADYRAVIVWHHRDGLAFDEIGRRLGRTPDAARRLWTRAIDRLQQQLSGSHP